MFNVLSYILCEFRNNTNVLFLSQLFVNQNACLEADASNPMFVLVEMDMVVFTVQRRYGILSNSGTD